MEQERRPGQTTEGTGMHTHSGMREPLESFTQVFRPLRHTEGGDACARLRMVWPKVNVGAGDGRARDGAHLAPQHPGGRETY